MNMGSLYTHDDKYYLITTRGTSYNISVEFGKKNQQILSNEFLINCNEVEFNLDNIIKIIMICKNLYYPIDENMITCIGNNRYVININRYTIVNNWLDIHNYLV